MNLVQINIPQDYEISTIGSEAFLYCKKLTGLGNYASSLKIGSIGSDAFRGCESLTPDGIRFHSIEGCTKTTDTANGVC
jgi:hypothetical protein